MKLRNLKKINNWEYVMAEKIRIGIDKNNSIKLELYILDLMSNFYNLNNYKEDTKIVNSEIRKLYKYVKEQYVNSSLSIVENLKKHIVLHSINELQTENENLKKLKSNNSTQNHYQEDFQEDFKEFYNEHMND